MSPDIVQRNVKVIEPTASDKMFKVTDVNERNNVNLTNRLHAV